MPNGNNEISWWQRGLETLFPPARLFTRPFWEEEGLRWPWEQPTQAAPAPPPGLTPRAYETLATLTPEERARLGPIPEEPLASQIARRKRAEEEAERAAAELAKPKPIEPKPTEAPPPGFRWAYDRELNRWVPQFAGLTPAQQAAQDLAQQKFEEQLRQWEWERQQAGQVSPYQQQQFGLQQQQQARQLAQQQQQYALQQQQFGLQEQRFAEEQAQFQQQLEFQQAQAQAATEEQERQYRSQLAAQPINWLQYAAYTGEEPVVQPWMVPLGFQNVGGTITPQAGQPIPGFEGQAGQQGIQTFAGLPQLRTPSAQLQARWGPTAQAQFLGYRQARTGAAPQETQFRLGAQRAPTGAFGGFSRFR